MWARRVLEVVFAVIVSQFLLVATAVVGLAALAHGSKGDSVSTLFLGGIVLAIAGFLPVMAVSAAPMVDARVIQSHMNPERDGRPDAGRLRRGAGDAPDPRQRRRRQTGADPATPGAGPAAARPDIDTETHGRTPMTPAQLTPARMTPAQPVFHYGPRERRGVFLGLTVAQVTAVFAGSRGRYRRGRTGRRAVGAAAAARRAGAHRRRRGPRPRRRRDRLLRRGWAAGPAVLGAAAGRRWIRVRCAG